MTDNVSALPERMERQEIPASNLPAVSAPPSPAEWNAMKQQAQVIAKSGLAPKSVSTPEKVLVIAMKGRELAIPPMQALSHIHIVEGKPTMSAELMVALVQRAGHKIRVLETNDEECVVEGERLDDPGRPSRVSFTIQEAEQAGVAGKQNWRRYPAAMLRARAISALCRFAFADVLMGVSYVPEELGAEVDEEGQVLNENSQPSHEESAVEVEGEASEAVEAEVVEDSGAEPSAEAGDILTSQIARIENLSESIWGDKRAVEKKVLKGHRIEELSQEAAKNVIAGLQRTKDKLQSEQASGGNSSGQPAMIREDQQERLTTALDELFPEADEEGASGHRRYEKEHLAKPITDLTEAQADEVLAWAEEQLAQKRQQRDKGELPATKKQLNFLESLIAEAVEDGVAKFEEMVGKPLGELTREEASDWISRLSGRSA